MRRQGSDDGDEARSGSGQAVLRDLGVVSFSAMWWWTAR